jgi:hypothetical protein
LSVDPGAGVGAGKLAHAAAIGEVLAGLDYFDLHHTANDTLDKIAPTR